ncbi:unnamed protein product [Rhizophagus irregularis]|nr:unnamed protein product [Rhizophagus irregularis]
MKYMILNLLLSAFFYVQINSRIASNNLHVLKLESTRKLSITKIVHKYFASKYNASMEIRWISYLTMDVNFHYK